MKYLQHQIKRKKNNYSRLRILDTESEECCRNQRYILVTWQQSRLSLEINLLTRSVDLPTNYLVYNHMHILINKNRERVTRFYGM